MIIGIDVGAHLDGVYLDKNKILKTVNVMPPLKSGHGNKGVF